MKKANKTQTQSAPEEELFDEPITSEETDKKPSFSSRVLETDKTAERPKHDRKKLMKKFRRAKKIPSESEVERFTPPLEKGLTAEQVETRYGQFLFNDVNKRYSKSYKTIFIGNICTFFNLLCILVAGALVYAQAPISQFLFVGIFAANLTIGVVQEILAKKQIDRLSVLVSANTKVMRNGERMEIPVNDIVLDDVILLEAGQQVPADCKLADGFVEVNE